MAHYAILDDKNIVIDVIVGKDNNEPLPEGYTSWEQYYGGKQTSYNTLKGKHITGGTPFRKNFAGIGYTFHEELNQPEGAFVPPCKNPDWVINLDTCWWEPRTPKPEDGRVYDWDETTYSWVLRA